MDSPSQYVATFIQCFIVTFCAGTASGSDLRSRATRATSAQHTLAASAGHWTRTPSATLLKVPLSASVDEPGFICLLNSLHHRSSICPSYTFILFTFLSDGIFRNITLRNVTINNFAGRFGANILMNNSNPGTGIVFDSVQRSCRVLYFMTRPLLTSHLTCTGALYRSKERQCVSAIFPSFHFGNN
jgi:hypothetical protein